MSYAEALNGLIEKSGLPVKEIAAKCSQYGVEISPSYISVLRNKDNKKTPSDEISRALAQVCGAEHADLLVVEAYIDEAPAAAKKIFEDIMETTVYATAFYMKDQLPEEQLVQAVEQMRQLPLAVYAIENLKIEQKRIVIEQGKLHFSESNTAVAAAGSVLSKHSSLSVDDDSMIPVLPKGSRVNLIKAETCSNGDIVCLKLNNSENLLFRKCVFLDNRKTKAALIPLNAKYETLVIDVSKLSIIGKVSEIITSI